MVTEQSTSQRSQDEIPEISAFRYTAASSQSSLNPLNLNGLAFTSKRRSLSNRMANGIRFLVAIATPKPEQAKFEPATEDMGVLRYHVPLQEYRARRRRSTSLARKLAIAGAVAAIIPLAMTISTQWHHSQPSSQPPAPVSAKANAPVAPVTTYVVQENDTLSSIARRHHVRLKVLRAANDMPHGDRLKLGQVLTIPAAVVAPARDANRVTAPGPAADERSLTSAAALAEHEATGIRKPAQVRKKRRFYVVKEGDSLSTIAARYGLRSADLIEVNDLDRHTRLRIGRKILIPATTAVKRKAEGRYRDRDQDKTASRGLVGDLGRVVSRKFLWPTVGRVSSYFGYRGSHFHAGLDIPNHHGAAIQASKAGVVVGAGWDGAYGKTVDISHGNGVVTRYAHCSKLLVHEGQKVERGQTIGLIGATGHATGPHLHYEVRVNGRPVDPKKFI